MVVKQPSQGHTTLGPEPDLEVESPFPTENPIFSTIM